MAIHSTTNIHHVARIQVRVVNFPDPSGFVSTTFTLTNDDGGEVSFSAFSKQPLAIEGSDHVNHVASGEREPETAS